VNSGQTVVTADAVRARPRHDDAVSRVDELRFDVVRLAALTNAAIRSGTEALLAADLDLAASTIADDDAVDALRHGIEDDCLVLLGRPLPPDALRLVGITLRVIHELERSADLMVDVAKATHRLHPSTLDAASRSIVERLGRQCVVQMQVAVNAFADLDPSGAAALADMDDIVDDLHKALLRHLMERPADRSDETLLRAVQLALVAHHYERIGDHAVNIGEQVYRVVEGRRRLGPRRAVVRT
jgi:phosphate transport system protein